ncbi:MAG: hypothetical protein HQL90_15780 [Magnetococcales bacterium]|nr:hypothetical protein [Magnetococcales bacterium]
MFSRVASGLLGCCRWLLVGRGRLWFLLSAMVWLPACGYHFPGSVERVESRWQNARLQIVGPGATEQPQLAFVLRDRLQARLGFEGVADGQGSGVTLKINLGLMERQLVTEDRTGRANLFRLTIRAKPVAEGGEGLPKYPLVHGTASYYEPFISTSVQATQKRAETEATEQLADTLVAVLSASF